MHLIRMFVASILTFFTVQLLFTATAYSSDTSSLIIEVHEIETEYKSSVQADREIVELSDSEMKTHSVLFQPMPEPETETFSVRRKTEPIPRTGEVIKSEFPSEKDLTPPEINEIRGTENDSLTVLRVVPQGRVRHLVSHVSVTFSAPVVEITSIDNITDHLPVSLYPQPEGAWRWVGTSTIIFEPYAKNLPQATHYTLTVDENLSSTCGKKIGGQRNFNFSTSPLRMTGRYPVGHNKRADVPVFIAFDQPIDPQSIAEKIEIEANDTLLDFRPGEIGELSDEYKYTISSMADKAGENYWVLLIPEQNLPLSSTIVVRLKSGAGSLEGPIPTDRTQSFSFRTYEPLVIERFPEGRRTPRHNWSFDTNNLIDTVHFDPSMVKITPEIESLSIRPSIFSARSIIIGGNTQPNTEYTVEFSREIMDEFGQNLTGDNLFTVDVGNLAPRFVVTSGIQIVDPIAPPTVSISTVNYRKVAMRVWRMQPEHWPFYSSIDLRKDEWMARVPGDVVIDDTIRITGELNETIDSSIDLSDYLPQGTGHLFVFATPVEFMQGIEPHSDLPKRIAWLQATNIGVDAWTDQEFLYVMATSLDEGNPLSGLEVFAGLNKGVTDDHGMAVVSLPDSATGHIVVKKKDDRALLPMKVGRQSTEDEALFHVLDVRGIYRPEDTVYVKGWVRKIAQQVGGDLEYLDSDSTLSFSVNDPRDNEIASGKALLSPSGGFDLSFPIPSECNLGQARIVMEIGEHSHTHRFSIQEFRTPEFEAHTELSAGPHFAEEELSATMTGKYYAGGSMAGSEVNWILRTENAFFRPSNLNQYRFGEILPFWDRDSCSNRIQSNVREEFSGVSDVSGMHTVKAKLSGFPGFRPVNLNFSATMLDFNGQRISSDATALVHPAKYYVGLKTDRLFNDPGKEASVHWVVADVNSKLIRDIPVTIRAERIKSRLDSTQGSDFEPEYYQADLMSTAEESTWQFTP
ncbi:hypothetical protein CHISP_3210 [Chitinispirillum alkaliphilum]|nr:hypothetical protein CHISP_3210 [Chitinispirillum alkaliphilum]